MINKRLLIKNLLAHNDENSFYDKKRKIDISHKEGKAKFLKHICALSNSNPKNNSYIVIGVEDEGNKIIGVDFYDDSKIQNLINAYLNNPPVIQYENVPFAHLPDDKVVGLVTIRPKSTITSLKKNIWKYSDGLVFLRDGSSSMPKAVDIDVRDVNSNIVRAIESHAQNNIEDTLHGVFDFMEKRKDYNPKFKVFKEYFVLCWAGQKNEINKKVFYSRVDIELINERVRLFFSNLDEVLISYANDHFNIIEYVTINFKGLIKYYPLERTLIQFGNNGNYSIDTSLLFEPPEYDKKELYHVYNSNNTLLEKLKTGAKLQNIENHDLNFLPVTYLLCHFNGFQDALDRLLGAKTLLKKHGNLVYSKYKEVMRILRKIKYS